MTYLKKILLVTFLLSSLSFSFAYAQNTTGGSGAITTTGGNSGCSGVSSTGLTNPLGDKCDLYELIEAIIDKVFLPIGGVLAVFFIIYSGFLLVTSAGNEEKLKTGKKTLIWSLIGSAILLGSWVIAKGIENTINEIKRTSIETESKITFLDR